MNTGPTIAELTAHLLTRANEVRAELGLADAAVDPNGPLTDLFDSMGLVEYLLALAQDFGVSLESVEECSGRRYGTVAELAAALQRGGLTPRGAETGDRADELGGAAHAEARSATPGLGGASSKTRLWLSQGATCLGDRVQTSREIDSLLDRPAGWFERHTGICERRLWHALDPLDAAAQAGRECLSEARLAASDVGALLVPSEAPPLLAGLAAALHHRLSLPASAMAVEIGGACTGFLAALQIARSLVPQTGPVLIIAVEAPSRYLRPGPAAAGQAASLPDALAGAAGSGSGTRLDAAGSGSGTRLDAAGAAAGETAALFGDGAAACLITREAPTAQAPALVDVALNVDGSAGHLLRAANTAAGIEVHMDGKALTARAIRAMARSVADLAAKHAFDLKDIPALFAHAGNGRFPRLLAAHLGIDAARIHSLTARSGNLGSASLPAAWAQEGAVVGRAALWTAVGAGLTWGAALTGEIKA